MSGEPLFDQTEEKRSGFDGFALQAFISSLGDEFGQMSSVVINRLDGVMFLNGTVFGLFGIDHLAAFGIVDLDFGFFLHIVKFLHFLLLVLNFTCPGMRLCP